MLGTDGAKLGNPSTFGRARLRVSGTTGHGGSFGGFYFLAEWSKGPGLGLWIRIMCARVGVTLGLAARGSCKVGSSGPRLSLGARVWAREGEHVGVLVC